MTDSPTHQRPDEAGESSCAFPGFEPLESNYVYCPNQFFDVCLKHCSRGALRIVGFVLRETLGWLDSNGQPIRQDIEVTYQNLISKAGVSRGAIGPALREAVAAGFLDCLRSGQPKALKNPSRSGLYRLRWAGEGDYTTDLDRFDGFFMGAGHRTPVPNRFFDHVIRQEPLSVVKVVGTVIRHTVGYQNQFGGRRKIAPLSHDVIARYANLSLGKTLSQAITSAQQSGYIARVKDGCFSPDKAEQQSATYTVRWQHEAKCERIGSKTPVASGQSNNPTSVGLEFPAADQFKKTSSRKTKKKDTLKQHQAAAAEKDKRGRQLLRNAGFDEETARLLANRFSANEIQRQIEWIDERQPRENRIGMLRRAIEQQWPKPERLIARDRQNNRRERDRQESANQEEERREQSTMKRDRQKRRTRLVSEWSTASTETKERWVARATEVAGGRLLGEMIHRQGTTVEVPHVFVLNVIAEDRHLPPVFHSELPTQQGSHDSANHSTARPERCHVS